jgi:hypothetical protein
MSAHVTDGKRGFLKTAVLGVGASAIGAAASPGVTVAQQGPRARNVTDLHNHNSRFILLERIR